MSAVLLRRAHRERININPFTLSGIIYPEIDNGYGKMIEDRAADPVEKSFTNPVRISTLKKNIQKKDTTGSPISVEKHYYFMISDNDTVVDVRLEFVYNGITLRVTQRKEIEKFSSLIGYEYELKDLTEGVYNA